MCTDVVCSILHTRRLFAQRWLDRYSMYVYSDSIQPQINYYRRWSLSSTRAASCMHFSGKATCVCRAYCTENERPFPIFCIFRYIFYVRTAHSVQCTCVLFGLETFIKCPIEKKKSKNPIIHLSALHTKPIIFQYSLLYKKATIFSSVCIYLLLCYRKWACRLDIGLGLFRKCPHQLDCEWVDAIVLKLYMRSTHAACSRKSLFIINEVLCQGIPLTKGMQPSKQGNNQMRRRCCSRVCSCNWARLLACLLTQEHM